VTGQYEARWPLMPNVVEDRELITGQGPTSAWRFGEAFLAALNTYNLSRVQSAPSVY
jgi:putative intracellular protease/amidase